MWLLLYLPGKSLHVCIYLHRLHISSQPDLKKNLICFVLCIMQKAKSMLFNNIIYFGKNATTFKKSHFSFDIFILLTRFLWNWINSSSKVVAMTNFSFLELFEHLLNIRWYRNSQIKMLIIAILLPPNFMWNKYI